ncbi:MAG: hypothetical protein LBV67_10965, partial [Streptococcaceae bacterium]|nr:hypothetical protein [Streptococcaceae bacterium]
MMKKMNMKKIIIINSIYYPTIIGGAEISTKILAEELNAEYEVTMLTTTRKKDKTIEEEIDGVKVIRIPTTNAYWMPERDSAGKLQKIYWHFYDHFSVKQFQKVEKIVDEIKPDLILIQNTPGFGTKIWNLSKKYRVVQTLRDYKLIEPTNKKIFNKILGPVNQHRSNKVK